LIIVLFSGGTFGLWIGWTILTIFEFFEFMSDLIFVKFMSKANKLDAET